MRIPKLRNPSVTRHTKKEALIAANRARQSQVARASQHLIADVLAQATPADLQAF